MSSDVLQVLILALIAITGLLARNVIGALKNINIYNMKWDWKLFWNSTLKLVVVISTLVLGVAAVGYVVSSADNWGFQINGADVIGSTAVKMALAAAALSAWGAAIIKALEWFGLSKSTIQSIQEAVANTGDGQIPALNVSVNDDGTVSVTASVETSTNGKTSQELMAEADPQVAYSGVEIPGRGSSNTYPAIYANPPIDTVVDPATCFNRECVSYVAWKIYEVTKKWLNRTGDMNAKNWIYRLPENGYKQVSAPAAGGKYVGISTAGEYGHALWWEGGNNVSEYNYLYYGGYDQRTINLGDYKWFQIVAAPAPKPAPKPAPAPSNVTYDKPTSNTFTTGSSVIAWGRGSSTSTGGGPMTKDFAETKMKIIAQQNGRLALNQYNTGKVMDASAITGWWPTNQVRKA